jgi:hypothetical protein
MILKPCLECEHHEILKCDYGRCKKENQHCIHTNCIREKALAFYFKHNLVEPEEK